MKTISKTKVKVLSNPIVTTADTTQVKPAVKLSPPKDKSRKPAA